MLSFSDLGVVAQEAGMVTRSQCEGHRDTGGQLSEAVPRVQLERWEMATAHRACRARGWAVICRWEKMTLRLPVMQWAMAAFLL